MFSNSSHLEPRLVCLVPCVFKPQSVQTPAVRTLIIYSVPIVSKPVYLRFLYRHPFGFWFFESALSLWLSTHLIPGFWLQLCSCLRFLPAPFVPCYIRFSDLDLDSVFDHYFVCRYCTVNLWLPGHDLCLNKHRFLHSPWSASGSYLRRNTNVMLSNVSSWHWTVAKKWSNLFLIRVTYQSNVNANHNAQSEITVV